MSIEGMQNEATEDITTAFVASCGAVGTSHRWRQRQAMEFRGTCGGNRFCYSPAKNR